MSMPESLQRRVAPTLPPRAECAVTGAPARYRDPTTGLPYATLDAYRELKRRHEAGLLPAAGSRAPAGALLSPGAAPEAAAPASGTRYSTRQAAQQTASPQQFAQLEQQQQQPLHQPELLFQQALGQQHYSGGVPAAPSPLDFFPQQHQHQHQQALGFGGIT